MQGLEQTIMIDPNAATVANWVVTLGVWVTIAAGLIAIGAAAWKVYRWYS